MYVRDVLEGSAVTTIPVAVICKFVDAVAALIPDLGFSVAVILSSYTSSICPARIRCSAVPIPAAILSGSIPWLPSHLKTLNLTKRGVYDDFFCELAQSSAAASLTELGFSDHKLTFKSAHCWKHFEQLRVLDISKNINFREAHFSAVAKLRNIERLTATFADRLSALGGLLLAPDALPSLSELIEPDLEGIKGQDEFESLLQLMRERPTAFFLEQLNLRFHHVHIDKLLELHRLCPSLSSPLVSITHLRLLQRLGAEKCEKINYLHFYDVAESPRVDYEFTELAALCPNLESVRFDEFLFSSSCDKPLDLACFPRLKKVSINNFKGSFPKSTVWPQSLQYCKITSDNLEPSVARRKLLVHSLLTQAPNLTHLISDFSSPVDLEEFGLLLQSPSLETLRVYTRVSYSDRSVEVSSQCIRKVMGSFGERPAQLLFKHAPRLECFHLKMELDAESLNSMSPESVPGLRVLSICGSDPGEEGNKFEPELTSAFERLGGQLLDLTLYEINGSLLHSLVHLKLIHTLDLSDVWGLGKIPLLSAVMSALPFLRKLSADNCSALPNLDWLRHKGLLHVSLVGCPELPTGFTLTGEYLPSLLTLKIQGNEHSSLLVSDHPNIRELLYVGAAKGTALKVSRCPKLEDATLIGWSQEVRVVEVPQLVKLQLAAEPHADAITVEAPSLRILIVTAPSTAFASFASLAEQCQRGGGSFDFRATTEICEEGDCELLDNLSAEGEGRHNFDAFEVSTDGDSDGGSSDDDGLATSWSSLPPPPTTTTESDSGALDILSS